MADTIAGWSYGDDTLKPLYLFIYGFETTSFIYLWGGTESEGVGLPNTFIRSFRFSPSSTHLMGEAILSAPLLASQPRVGGGGNDTQTEPYKWIGVPTQ